MQAPVRCLYWPAESRNPAAALAGFIETKTQIVCDGDLTNILKSNQRLVIIIDRFERILWRLHQNKPIFDLLGLISHQPAPHLVQIIVAFKDDYYTEWLEFQDEWSVQPPRVAVDFFTITEGSAVMKTILQEAAIDVEPGLVDKYIHDLASVVGQVSPVGIALGAIAFSRWHHHMTGKARLSQRTPLGGYPAVLRAHVRQSFNPPAIRLPERQPLLRAILANLVTPGEDSVNSDGASMDSIAKAADLPLRRVRTYLRGLEDSRILEKKPPSGNYVLAHESLVQALRDLDRNLTPRDQAIIDQYLLWKRDEKKKYLLRGRKLHWALSDIPNFVSAVDLEDRVRFLNSSINAEKRRYIYAAVLVVIGCICLWTSSVRLKIYGHHNELKAANLSPDIYEVQGRLDSLTIKPATGLQDLDWLETSDLGELRVTSPNLSSLHGLEAASGLQILEIDLDGAPVESLSGIARLDKLQCLILRHLGAAKNPLVLDVNGLQNLKALELDLEGSRLSSLPSLTNLPALEGLTLNLKSTKIADLSELTKLNRLVSLSVYLDGSRVSSLTPLAQIPNLQFLGLSLDGTQFHLLSDLDGIPGPLSLTLDKGSSFLLPMPDLSSIHGLRGLTLNMEGAPPEQIPDVARIRNLRELSLTLTGSDVSVLPDLGQLRALQGLALGLEATEVRTLPDLSQLHDLRRLTLNLNGSKVSDLPDFSRLGGLTELTLSLKHPKFRSLHNIGRLTHLQSLSLTIGDERDDERIDDLNSISRLVSLEKLVLYLPSQLQNFPDLSHLSRLRTLELHFEGSGTPDLHDISNLTNLTELGLFLDGSPDNNLPDFSRLNNLRKITLSLKRSHIHDLSRLSQVNNLESLVLDLQDTSLQILPDLTHLQQLRAVVVDIRGSKIKSLDQIRGLAKLEDLTADQNFPVKNLPQTIRKLRMGDGPPQAAQGPGAANSCRQ